MACYSPFFIPKSILDTYDSDTQSTSTLFQQLPELIILTLRQLGAPSYQVCFALTCKRIALIASNYRGAFSPGRGWRDKHVLFDLLSRNIPFHNLTPWIPRHLRVCKTCWQFVPNDQTYWFRKLEPTHGHEGTRRIMKYHRFTRFFEGIVLGYERCPTCYVSEYRECFTFRTYNKVTKAKSLALEEVLSLFHPKVLKRLDRPEKSTSGSAPTTQVTPLVRRNFDGVPSPPPIVQYVTRSPVDPTDSGVPDSSRLWIGDARKAQVRMHLFE